VAAAPCGSDTPVAGQPYATIGAAIAAVGPGSLAALTLVLVAPGFYPAFALPAYCYVTGSGYSATSVAGVTLDVASWNSHDPADPLNLANPLNAHKSGMQDLGVTGVSAFDLYAAPASLIALLYLTNVRLQAAVLWRTSRPLQQLLMIGCDLVGDVVQRGGAVFWQGNSTAGSIDVYPPDINPAVQLVSGEGLQHSACYLYDGAQIGTNRHVRFHNNNNSDRRAEISKYESWCGSRRGTRCGTRCGGCENGCAPCPSPCPSPPPPPSPRAETYVMTGFIDAFSCAAGVSAPEFLPVLGIVGNGVSGQTNVYCSAIGVPAPALVAVSNEGALVRTTFANAIAYDPADPRAWKRPPPRTVQEALDRIARAYGPF
jgi:hypothetical protein